MTCSAPPINKVLLESMEDWEYFIQIRLVAETLARVSFSTFVEYGRVLRS